MTGAAGASGAGGLGTGGASAAGTVGAGTAGAAGSAAGADGIGTGGAGGSTAGSGGAGTGAGPPALYLAIQQNTVNGTTNPDDLIRIDIATGVAVADVSLNGVSAIAYRGGALLVPRAYGYTRVSVLDPNSLALLRTVLLPWDPARAVFSTDGRWMYAGHGDGQISRVRMTDGVITGSVQIPPSSVDNGAGEIVGLALDPTETLLVATTFAGDGVGQVAMVRVTGDTLNLARSWVPPMFSGSNCSREPSTPAFNRAGTAFATFDRNCAAFELYDATNGSPQITPMMLARPASERWFSAMIVDALDQFWTSNSDTIYRIGVDRTQQSMFSIGGLEGMLAADVRGQTIYFVADDPRTNGIFTIDSATGAGTRLPWNLDLVPLGAFIVVASMADPP